MDMEGLFSLKGKVALVTGGASGIGRMIAEGLVSAGVDVTIASRKLDVCQAVAEELSSLGTCRALKADLSSGEGCAALAAAMGDQTERLDILVNNSGKTWGAPMKDFPWHAWDGVMGVNVAAPFTLTRELLPLLEAAAGPKDPARVINIGSVMGTRPRGNNAYSYAASKAAVHHLTRILSNELAAKQITVNALAPGPFPSRMMAFVTENPQALEAMKQSVPLGRVGGPEDAAGAVHFLCSRAASFVSGAILPLDGGMSAKE